jgi:hypothetical protein
MVSGKRTAANRRGPYACRAAICRPLKYLRTALCRKIALDGRLKIHDIVLDGIDAALRRRGYASIESLKAGKKW